MASSTTALEEQIVPASESKPEEEEKFEQEEEEKDEQEEDDKYEAVDAIEIIDTHIHLWNVKTAKREWLNGKEMEVLCRTYDINGYYSLLNNQTSAPFLHLRAGIFMETDVVDQDIGTEISEITAVCKNPNNNLRGMIVKLDPNIPSKDFVQKLNELKKNPYIVGLRRVLLEGVTGIKSEMPKQFKENMQILSKDKDVNWPFDLCANIHQLPHIYEVVKSCKDQMFVLDHMANGHEICGDDNVFKQWSAEIERFSKLDNVAVKLSGLSGGQPGATGGNQWSFEMETKRIDFVLKHFSADKIVYGSDWPVSILPISQENRDDFLSLWTMNLYRHLAKQHGKEFAQNVFVHNAGRIYGLK